MKGGMAHINLKRPLRFFACEKKNMSSFEYDAIQSNKCAQLIASDCASFHVCTGLYRLHSAIKCILKNSHLPNFRIELMVTKKMCSLQYIHTYEAKLAFLGRSPKVLHSEMPKQYEKGLSFVKPRKLCIEAIMQ